MYGFWQHHRQWSQANDFHVGGIAEAFCHLFHHDFADTVSLVRLTFMRLIYWQVLRRPFRPHF